MLKTTGEIGLNTLGEIWMKLFYLDPDSEIRLNSKNEAMLKYVLILQMFHRWM